MHSNNRRVALRKESVDRNAYISLLKLLILMSLSARRAWIEMANSCAMVSRLSVALRKESVDRNPRYVIMLAVRCVSLSARRAWIEIRFGKLELVTPASLSARRAWIEIQ